VADSGALRAVTVDVTDEAAVGRLVEGTVEQFGKVDIVVTAAGIQRYGAAADTEVDEWNHVLAVNLTGCFLAVKHALPFMRRAGAGSIVMVSSVQAYVTQAQTAAYSTSKAALNGLARSLAVDEAPHGIRANAVCPGSVDTPDVARSRGPLLRWE
jgi:NAD(P)-dependent dehydrogenase (short-subunit alcohol dehydrogenase family)